MSDTVLQNILIRSQPPDSWWVKVCDLGLTKRIEDIAGSTTVRGTFDFMPPEMVGFDGNPRSADPFFADMWCFGEMVSRMLTNRRTFDNLNLLFNYKQGGVEFPTRALYEKKASEDAINFIRSLMDSEPKKRLTAVQAFEHSWVKPALQEPSSPTELLPLEGSLGPEDWNPHVPPTDQLTQPSGEWSMTDNHPATARHLDPLAHPTNRPIIT